MHMPAGVSTVARAGKRKASMQLCIQVSTRQSGFTAADAVPRFGPQRLRQR